MPIQIWEWDLRLSKYRQKVKRFYASGYSEPAESRSAFKTWASAAETVFGYAYRSSWRCASCGGCVRLHGTLSKEGVDSSAFDHVAGDHCTALCPSHVSRLRVRRHDWHPDFCEPIYAWIGSAVFRRFLR